MLAAPVFLCKLLPVSRLLALMAALACATANAAELNIQFAETPEGQTPAGFTNLLAGGGKPGEWKVVLDEVTPLIAPLTPQAPSVTRKAVLAQISRDSTDERFPMLAYEGETFGDFTLTTRLKIIGGEAEQMAGIAFRLQDAQNFYVIRASALGRNVRFYKVVNGQRGNLIGPELEVPTNQWHELTIECKGNEIRCKFNGAEVFPPLSDATFRTGKIAFWTKSDSLCYFTDTRIQYTPRIPLGQQIVTSVIHKNSRLIALKIYALNEGTNATHVIASSDEAEISSPGGEYELDCIQSGQGYFSKNSGYAAVVMPLRDHNGEIVAAARVHMTTFPGQTERNAVIRAKPIVNEIEKMMRSSQDPLD